MLKLYLSGDYYYLGAVLNCVVITSELVSNLSISTEEIILQAFFLEAVVSESKMSPLSSNYVRRYVRFEVFTAVTMKNGVFWDMKTQFVLHRRHITSPLQISAS
jgi:hypothetical protein